jgi:hypothetical protein
LQQAIRDYTNNLVKIDWPQMATSHYIADAHSNAFNMWHLVATYKGSSSREETIVDKSLDQLDQITDAASLRDLYYHENLPHVVWLVIYVGCINTIGFSYFFGLETFNSQALMCAVFSGLLGLTILAILELSHPYQGNQTVSSAPFSIALRQMDRIDRMAMAGVAYQRAEGREGAGGAAQNR